MARRGKPATAGRRPRRSRALLGVVGLVGLGLAIAEMPYLNWEPVVAPVDTQPLVIRQDARGDGEFLAPRSGGRTHRGIDLAAPLGSPVRAIRSGRVLEAESHHGLGQYVTLRHGQGLTSLYAHLEALHVRRGARVRQGQQIGTVGKTGNARHRGIEPHVHLEVARDGVRFDPLAMGLAEVTEASAPEAVTDGRGGT